MKERPILFSTPMIKAIQSGQKTQTRRTVKGLVLDDDSGYAFLNYKHQMDIHRWKDRILEFCPYGQPGDVLWVRETWADGGNLTSGPGFIYKANDYPDDFKKSIKWKPSIFMPKEACRIKLEIVNVRIERLWDISEEDAKAEGIQFHDHEPVTLNGVEITRSYKDYMNSNLKTPMPCLSFMTLWQSINGEQSWEDNPFVWVLKFRKI